MGWDDQMRDLNTFGQVHVRTGDEWRGCQWDGMIRWDLKTSDQVHVLSGDGWSGWNGMIRWVILKHLAKFTYFLETKGWDGMIRWDLKTFGQIHVRTGDGWRGWDGMIRWEILKHLAKFTYSLETDEEDGMGWSVRDLKTFGQVHIRPGDGWRGWDEMMRWEILKYLAKFTYELETDEEDGMGLSDERS